MNDGAEAITLSVHNAIAEVTPAKINDSFDVEPTFCTCPKWLPTAEMSASSPSRA